VRAIRTFCAHACARHRHAYTARSPAVTCSAASSCSAVSDTAVQPIGEEVVGRTSVRARRSRAPVHTAFLIAATGLPFTALLSVICHVIHQILDIARNLGPRSHLNFHQPDCALQKGDTCMCEEGKDHARGVLVHQREKGAAHHTTLHLYPLSDLYFLIQKRFKIVGLACVFMVVLGVVGLYIWHVTPRTRTPCDFSW